jgi:hypothetical protein
LVQVCRVLAVAEAAPQAVVVVLAAFSIMVGITNHILPVAQQDMQ